MAGPTLMAEPGEALTVETGAPATREWPAAGSAYWALLVIVLATFITFFDAVTFGCLLYTSPSPRDRTRSRMPSSA